MFAIDALKESDINSRILIGQRCLRKFGYGQTGLILALFFQSLDVSDQLIGLFMSLTLFGDVIISLILTYYADRIGRRLVIKVGCLGMILSGIIFALSSNYWVLLVAAIVGVISASGDETGPFKSVEESILSHLTREEHLSDLYAWYGILDSLFNALGSLSSGWIVHYNADEGFRLVFWCYAIIGIIKLLSTFALSEKCEEIQSNDESDPLLPSTSQSKESVDVKLIVKLCLLFGLDSLGYGFMSNSWLVIYFKQKFKLSESFLGSLLFFTTLIGSMTQLLSSWVTKLTGAAMALVLTKFPCAASMAAIPTASTVQSAIGLLIIRTATDSMDVVPRQVLLSTIVPRKHRTRTMGAVNVAKTLTRGIGPYFTGTFSQHGALWLAFACVGALESIYGILVVALLVSR